MGKHKTKVDKKEKEKKKAAKKEAIDENMAKQVTEMEIRLRELTEQSKKVEARMRNVEIERRRCELTRAEIEKFPDDNEGGINFYKPFGRIFLKSTKKEVVGDMTTMIEDKGGEIPKLRQTHAQFENKMKSEANNLKELIGQDNLRALFGGMSLAGGPEAAPSAKGPGKG